MFSNCWQRLHPNVNMGPDALLFETTGAWWRPTVTSISFFLAEYKITSSYCRIASFSNVATDEYANCKEGTANTLNTSHFQLFKRATT